jgi:hypothetical protein
MAINLGANGSISVGPQALGAAEIVTDGFTAAQQYASAAFAEATQFLQGITNVAANLAAIPPISGDLSPITATVDPFVMPATVAPPTGLALNLPAVPTEPTLMPVPVPSFGNAPTFTATLPEIDIPNQPAPLNATVPTLPALNPVNVPANPDVPLPDVPTLLGINVPTEPLLNLPTFTAITPTHPLAPGFFFSFAEPTYNDQLLTDLKAVLDTWVNGTNTGLSAAVEQAIWDQARTRENVQLAAKMKQSIRNFATKGFVKPSGALNLDLLDAQQQSNSTLSGLSRDIMIKQADLEQTNRRFAFEQAWKVEEGLITYQNQIAQRAYDAAKFAQQAMIDIYHEQVVAYTADIQAYAAQVEVFKALITAELSKLDVYKAELEGQKLIGDLNQQSVAIYTARVQAALAVVEIFKAEVDAANTVASVNKTIIDGYAAQVGAYGEQVRAKASEYDAYATVVKAQVSKADIFKTQADAFSSQINGFKTTVDAAVEQANLAIKVGQEVPLDLFKARTEVYRDVVGAEASRVDAVAKVYTAQVSGYNAAVSGQASRSGAQVAVVDSQTKIATATADVRIEAAKANVQTLIQETQLLTDAIKAGATVAAQLASASLASVNLSAQLGDHYSESVSSSEAASSSIATNISTANNTTDSTVTSNNTGNNTNTNYNYSN